jgi:DNA repair protein RecN (Recombination protein N)
VLRELPPVKLQSAKFITQITALEEKDWNEHGRERVHFEVSTNPGALPGPLAKIVSGGELSRFMLALKIVLSKVLPVPTLVFDEVDSGIGGATAAAVGERLRRLAADMQVLVVTHSPQVAALGHYHLRITKENRTSNTRVDVLPPEQRREEIARMLSGKAITPAARAAADSLMSGARS